MKITFTVAVSIGMFMFVTGHAFAQGSGMMGPGMMGWGYGMGWLGWIFMIIFWIVVIAGVVLLVRWIVSTGEKSRGPQLSKDTAIDILKKRYAKGEVSKEEYERMKKDIS